jgi:hypothetical protein
MNFQEWLDANYSKQELSAMSREGRLFRFREFRKAELRAKESKGAS